jgi:hypothetical protein
MAAAQFLALLMLIAQNQLAFPQHSPSVHAVAHQELTHTANDLLKSQRVDVFAKLQQHEPVTDVTVVVDLVERPEVTGPCHHADDVQTTNWRQERDSPVDELQKRHDRDENEPKPQHDENLLVDDVQWQHAETVKLFDAARRTELLERALGDLGKDPGHGVGPLLVVHVDKGQHLAAVGRELVVQEGVDNEDLRDGIDKVEDLAGEEAIGVKVLAVKVGFEVVEQALLLLDALALLDEGILEVLDEVLHAVAFPRLPDVAGNVEANG